MMDNKVPFEVMSIYDNKMLASRIELAIMRVKRTGSVIDRDAIAFSRMSDLLNYAAEGDIAISGSHLAASSEQSLEVLREVIKALVDRVPETQLIRQKLEGLKNTAMKLAQKQVPSSKDLDDILNFSHKYGLVQAELLKERYSSAPTEATIWPMLTHLGYSSMS